MAEEKLDQWSAAYHGNYEWFNKNQLSSLNIDKKDDAGRSALYSASKKGHLSVVMHLVMEGADINCIGPKGSTPLHAAAFCGHGTIVQFLVGHDCKTDIKNEYGLTAAEEAEDDKMKQLILHPERGDTERFTVRKRDLPAFLDDVDSIISTNALYDWHLDFRQKAAREQLIKEMEMNYDNFASQLKGIIDCGATTWNKMIIQFYTMESPLYKRMNADLAAVNKLSEHKIYANALAQALEHDHLSLPRWPKDCYRSVYLNSDQIKSFESAAYGSRKNYGYASLPAFSSCTKSKEIALGWGGNAVMVIHPPGDCQIRRCFCRFSEKTLSAVDISSLSPFAEEEVLLSWSTQINILGIKQVSYDSSKVEYEIEIHLSQADREQFISWFKNELELPQYIDLFIQYGVEDFDKLMEVTKDDLSEMGINKFADRIKIMKAINRLKQMSNYAMENEHVEVDGDETVLLWK